MEYKKDLFNKNNKSQNNDDKNIYSIKMNIKENYSSKNINNTPTPSLLLEKFN